ncbi:MAG: hypothetical protein ACXWTY_00580 [Methylobacter sp.]
MMAQSTKKQTNTAPDTTEQQSIDLATQPIKVRQTQDRRATGDLSNATPPAHVAALLQAEGMNYNPATFAAMTLEQHTEEGFKGLRVSVLSAVYSGAHFVQALDFSKRLEKPRFIQDEAERLGMSFHSVYNMMNMYKLFCRSPEKVLKTFSKLDYSKLLELKNLDESDLEQLAEGQEVYGITLETAQSYSVRELKSVLQSHRAEVKTLKQKVIDTERRMNTEADKAAELLAENLELKKLTPERRSFLALRKQLFEDMETLQGIVVRARKTYELSKNFQQDVRYEAQEAVIYPLIHLLSVMHGNSELIMEDCYMTWGIDPAIPVNPPQPNSMTHEERWAAQESARYQAALTELHFPTAKKPKTKKDKGDQS